MGISGGGGGRRPCAMRVVGGSVQRRDNTQRCRPAAPAECLGNLLDRTVRRSRHVTATLPSNGPFGRGLLNGVGTVRHEGLHRKVSWACSAYPNPNPSDARHDADHDNPDAMASFGGSDTDLPAIHRPRVAISTWRQGCDPSTGPIGRVSHRHRGRGHWNWASPTKGRALPLGGVSMLIC